MARKKDRRGVKSMTPARVIAIQGGAKQRKDRRTFPGLSPPNSKGPVFKNY